MKNSNNMSRLSTGSKKSTGINISRLMSATDLVNGSNAGATSHSTTSLRPGAARDFKSLSLLTTKKLTGIQFGSPSSSGTSLPNSNSGGGVLTSLLKQTTSGGGLSGVLSGGLANLGGFGSLISGITSLFGSGAKKTLPALTRFQLPTSQEQTVYVGSNGSTVYQGNAVEPAIQANAAYMSSQQTAVSPMNVDAQWFVDNSIHIAQAVKNAMLHSNSINDVVSEL